MLKLSPALVGVCVCVRVLAGLLGLGICNGLSRSVGVRVCEARCGVGSGAHGRDVFGSRIGREYPLNLSILLSGGKETN